MWVRGALCVGVSVGEGGCVCGFLFLFTVFLHFGFCLLGFLKI